MNPFSREIFRLPQQTRNIESLRVLQLAQKPQRRGAEVFAYELSEELRRRHVEVRIFYLYDFLGERPLPVAFPDLCLGGEEENFMERIPGVHPGLVFRLLSHIRSFRPHVIQANGGRTVKYGATASCLLGSKPIKLVYRNIGFPSHWHRGPATIAAYRALVIPFVDGVISVCQDSLQDASKLYRLRVPRLVIRNGIDPRRLEAGKERNSVESVASETARRLGDVVVLFLGSLSPEKGPDRFLRVLAQLAAGDQRIRGWIVGDGAMRPALEQLAVDLGIRDRCTFFGYQDNVASFLSRADLLLLTSTTEGMPAVVLEAGYLSVPVVAARVGGLAECVEDGRTGILVDSPSDESFVAAISHLLQNDELRRQMAAEARGAIRDRFTLPSIAAEYLAFYRQLLAEGPAPWSECSTSS